MYCNHLLQQRIGRKTDRQLVSTKCPWATLENNSYQRCRIVWMITGINVFYYFFFLSAFRFTHANNFVFTILKIIKFDKKKNAPY